MQSAAGIVLQNSLNSLLYRSQSGERSSKLAELSEKLATTVAMSGEKAVKEPEQIKTVQSASTEDSSVNLSRQAQEIFALQARDSQVRTHEQAHLAVAGAYATSAANYTYTQGPDGKRYVTGGEVSIDVSPVANDPQATIQKAMIIAAAANAPADPSGQDRAVAAQANEMANQAGMELLQLRLDARIQESDSVLDTAAKASVPEKKANAVEGSLVDAYTDVAVWPMVSEESSLDLEV
jgi:hypothetical protein